MINDEYFLKIFIIKIQKSIFLQKNGKQNFAFVIDIRYISLKYRLSIIGLFLLQKSETTCQHLIYIIDSQNHNLCHSRSDFMNFHYYCKLT